ncbi:MAG TPA: DUF2723 domain-containing protein [Gemmatimonadaceae bacterium]|nr:DUF2723 domain-containing protein [Gemmatimonadaceae bacterium]
MAQPVHAAGARHARRPYSAHDGRAAGRRGERITRPRTAGLAAAAALLAAYAATLAPSVTFWDAGEFIAAAEGLGIPHPPGTPLWVIVARAWSALLPFGTALATNLLSAACTAAAAGIAAALVARWLGRAAYGIAAGLSAGAMSAVWASATETEVYAMSLLLSLAMVAIGDRAGRRGDSSVRWTLLLGFAFALAPAVHLSALVAAPAAVVLAARSDDGLVHLDRAAALLAAFVLAAAVGTGRLLLAGAAAAALIGLAVARPGLRRTAPAMLGVAFLAFTALGVLLVRAGHDPVLNQGDPSTFATLLDVIARRQYEVAPLWPRQAPLWLQLGNLIEYTDWQVALGLAPGVVPSPARTPFTILFLALGGLGCIRHREIHRRGWLATSALLACASVGVVVYLNLKAGPSFGYGILPDEAPREPREREYFFALAFFTWGLWAGVGAVATSLRWLRGRAWPGVALSALPIALNWPAMDRRSEPEASLPRVLASELLAAVPSDGVLFVWGDNDTYPLWYLQQVERVREDVTVVTVPLLGAGWYRNELRRRHGLVTAEETGRWRGETREVASVAELAHARGRPVTMAVTIPGAYRRSLSGVWVLRGMVHSWDPSGTEPWLDAATADEAARRVAPLLAAPRPRDVIDPTPWTMREFLRCPGLVVALAGGDDVESSLDMLCNRR